MVACMLLCLMLGAPVPPDACAAVPASWLHAWCCAACWVHLYLMMLVLQCLPHGCMHAAVPHAGILMMVVLLCLMFRPKLRLVIIMQCGA